MTIYINRRFNNSNSDMGIKSCLLKRWTPPVWPIFEISKIVLIKTNKYHSKILLHLNRILTNLTFLNSIFQHGFCETHLDFISTIFLVYNSEFDLHKKAKTWISLKSFKLVFLTKKGPLVSLNLVLKKNSSTAMLFRVSQYTLKLIHTSHYSVLGGRGLL